MEKVLIFSAVPQLSPPPPSPHTSLPHHLPYLILTKEAFLLTSPLSPLPAVTLAVSNSAAAVRHGEVDQDAHIFWRARSISEENRAISRRISFPASGPFSSASHTLPPSHSLAPILILVLPSSSSPTTHTKQMPAASGENLIPGADVI